MMHGSGTTHIMHMYQKETDSKLTPVQAPGESGAGIQTCTNECVAQVLCALVRYIVLETIIQHR